MLSCSHPKIHEPLVIGVSPRRTDRRQRQKLRNTRGEPSEKETHGPPRAARLRAGWIVLRGHSGEFDAGGDLEFGEGVAEVGGDGVRG